MKNFLIILPLLLLLALAPLANANPTLTLTVITDKEIYGLGDEVKINGTVTVDGSPIPDAVVGIQIDNTTETAATYLVRSRPTSTSYTGKYTLEVTDVFLSDQYGNPASSVRQGEIAYFRVKVRNNEEIEHYVTLIPYFQAGQTPLLIDTGPAFQGPIAGGIAYDQKFGKEAVGSQFTTIGGDTKFASCFQLGIPTSHQANVTTISWRGFSETSVHAKAVIYNSNATDGRPLSLAGTSQETTISATNQWWNFTFSPVIVLTTGYYWLGIIAEPATLHFSYDPAYVPEINVSAFAYNNDLYLDGPSNPFGTPTYLNRSMSIYATYTLVQNYGIDTIFPKLIPDSTPTGTATIYINAFRGSYPNCMPKNRGTAYCPDKPKNFTITPKTAASSLSEANSQTAEPQSDDGYYELRFKPKRGNFTLYTSCYYQGETANQSLTFLVRLMGDVNNDGKVEGKDIAIASRAFNTKPGDELWDPRADLNNDNRVDGKDIAIISKYFGTIG